MENRLVNPNFTQDSQSKFDISPILFALNRLQQVIQQLEMPEPKDVVEVSNLDVIQLALRKELAKVVKAVKGIEIPEGVEEVKVTNLTEMVSAIEKLEGILKQLDFKPTINIQSPDVIVPEIKMPEFPTIPAPIVNIPKQPDVYVNPAPVNLDISPLMSALAPLSLLSRDPNKPITVRLTDGKAFYNAVAQFKESAEKYAFAVSNSSGISKDEYKAAQRELYDAATASNGAVTVGAVSTSVLSARNRISIILTNDSTETIYVAKGSTATMNQGIRLNASGGAIVIDDWNGAVSAICSSGSKNLCYCETY